MDNTARQRQETLATLRVLRASHRCDRRRILHSSHSTNLRTVSCHSQPRFIRGPERSPWRLVPANWLLHSVDGPAFINTYHDEREVPNPYSASGQSPTKVVDCICRGKEHARQTVCPRTVWRHSQIYKRPTRLATIRTDQTLLNQCQVWSFKCDSCWIRW